MHGDWWMGRTANGTHRWEASEAGTGASPKKLGLIHHNICGGSGRDMKGPSVALTADIICLSRGMYAPRRKVVLPVAVSAFQNLPQQNHFLHMDVQDQCFFGEWTMTFLDHFQGHCWCFPLMYSPINLLTSTQGFAGEKERSFSDYRWLLDSFFLLSCLQTAFSWIY